MKEQDSKLHKISICVENSTPALLLSGLSEPFEIANELLGYKYYDVQTYTDLREMCAKPIDVRFSAAHLSQIFAGGYQNRWLADEKLANRLRHTCRTSYRSTFVGSGIFLAELAGLLEVGRAAVHGNFRAILEEELYDFNAVDEPFWIEKNIYTATGSVAGIRVCLDFIRSDLGEYIYEAISSYMGCQETKVTNSTIDLLRWDCATYDDELVNTCIQEMTKNIEAPLGITELAQKVDVSTRQMERRFKAQLNSSPSRVYREIRLSFARKLVLQSKVSIIDVSLASGYEHHQTFSRQYKNTYGVTPSNDRLTKVVIKGLSVELD